MGILSFLKRLWRDTTAEVSRIIRLVVALFVMSALLPVAFANIINAGQNTTVFSGATGTLWMLIPVMCVIGAFLLILKAAGVLGGR